MAPTQTHPQARAKWHDAYDAQMALWRWYRTKFGYEWLSESYRMNSQGMMQDTREMLSDLYRAEHGRLLDQDPIFVSAEMCEVVEFAAETFQPEPLLETDLITPRGFMLYEKPFLVPDRFDEPIEIAAVSWSRTFASDTEGQAKAIKQAMRGEAGDVAEIEEKILEAGATASGIAVTIYTPTPERYIREMGAPAIIPFHLTPWYFQMTFDGNEIDENGVPTGAAWWWKIVQTTFRLMLQPISVKHQYRPDRNARREAKRLAFPDEQTVVVVRLRREESERSEPSGETANYSHRFIVNGHWRNQPYRSEGIIRQIWISPYVKGDPSLPLIVKPRRVFQWDR